MGNRRDGVQGEGVKAVSLASHEFVQRRDTGLPGQSTSRIQDCFDWAVSCGWISMGGAIWLFVHMGEKLLSFVHIKY